VPDPNHGYTLDDNARALIVALKWHQHASSNGSIESTHQALDLAYRYLAFMLGSQREDGRFRNVMAFERHWLENVGSPDSQGRALWALGYCLRYAPEAGLRQAAEWMFDRAVDRVSEMSSPRTTAFAMHGFAEAYQVGWQTSDTKARLRQCANQLMGLFTRHARQAWQWYEYSLTYANATLPHALLVAADVLDDVHYRDVGRRSLDFLISLLFEEDQLDLIGQSGWYSQGGERASFDQQPIDAQCMVEALLYAHSALGEPRYEFLAKRALEWFYGRNRNSAMMYDETTGGCLDGLTADGVNLNQGAESTLAHLLARLAWEESESNRTRVAGSASNGRKFVGHQPGNVSVATPMDASAMP
jgi:hypothetical protein